MGEVKQINITNRTSYFYNDIIDLKKFDAGLLKIHKKPFKDIGFTIFDILRLKKLIIVKIFKV